MRRFLLAAAVPLIAAVHTVTPVAGSTPVSCYVVAIALLIDDVKDVAELPLPALTATEAEAAACAGNNKALEQSQANYRWAC